MGDQPQGRESDLRALAKAKFGELSYAEKLLLEKVPIGKLAICDPSSDDKDCHPPDYDPYDPKYADCWGPARQIRAGLIGWLCMDQEARKRVHWRGIMVYGADISGPLDLSFVSIPFQLALQHCRLKETVNLRRAELSQFDLQSSLVHGIGADGVIVKNNVFFKDGFAAVGEVRLPRAHIGGDLDCRKGSFTNPARKDVKSSGTALRADGIDVKGNVFLTAQRSMLNEST